MWYELFIRQAFLVDRGEDPAHMAEQGIADYEENINDIKAAVGYSILILANRYLSPSPSTLYIDALASVMSASSIEEIKVVVINISNYLKEHNLWKNRQSY